MASLDHIYEKATTFIGIEEIKGPEHNPTILGWLKQFGKNLGRWATGRDETAWCAVFVSMVLNACGYEGTNHALASSYTTWGVPSRPIRGAVIVIKRKKSGADTRTGSRAGFHVGILKLITKHYIVILGGNQSNKVCVSWFPRGKYDIVAIRRPADLETGTTQAA